ncbi:phosphopantetheine-binding protein [Streptomyces sp. G5(2025)]|uniref:phosphopantetheine-binding protein n=1 Tax=Streptomyces sp. G5(2025) TaxID=3406628 RepID=UPI003C2971C1
MLQHVAIGRIGGQRRHWQTILAQWLLLISGEIKLMILNADGEPKEPRRAPKTEQAATAELSTPASASEIRNHVLNAWVEVLGHKNFDDTTQFFEAGGQSMKATQVLMKLRRHTGMRLPIRLVFDNPTVRELTAAVEHEIAKASAPAE